VSYFAWRLLRHPRQRLSAQLYSSNDFVYESLPVAASSRSRKTAIADAPGRVDSAALDRYQEQIDKDLATLE